MTVETLLDSNRRQALLGALDSRWRTTGDLIKRSQVEVCLSKSSQLLNRCMVVGQADCKYKSQGTWLQPLWRRHKETRG